MSSYNVDIENSSPFSILQSKSESLGKSYKILSVSAVAQAAFKFKEV